MRHTTVISYRNVLTAKKPHKALTTGRKRDVGRNADGRITVRHKGGGHKRAYREIDFKFDKKNIIGTVETVEYDPNRTSFISLICYKDGERRYIITPKGMKVGDTILTAETTDVRPGNRMPLKNIPAGTFIYNIEIHPEGGAKLVRTAGSYAELAAKDAPYAHVKMPSGEVRKVHENAWASIGVLSNEENKLRNIGKAGRNRWLGIRPTVRGSVMNPVDHPHGGGEGRQGRGLRRAKTAWGKPSGKGQKTRTPKKYSNVFIVSRRKTKKKK
jgi:large subunit ribosomal protein L2